MQISALMPNDIDEISHLLGQLGGKLDALNDQFKDNAKATRVRWTGVHARLDSQDKVAAELLHRLDNTVEEVRYLKEVIDKDVKPVTDDVKRWRLMGMGALAIVGIGGAAFGSGLLWLWDNVASRLKWPS